MKTITCFTLFDITHTNVLNRSKPVGDNVELWNIQRNSQAAEIIVDGFIAPTRIPITSYVTCTGDCDTPSFKKNEVSALTV